jgi:hypothetical protein
MSGLNINHPNQSFERVTIRPKEIVCDSLSMEMVTKKGIIIQYLNSNPTGATTMIGVTRIGLKDPRRVPAYLERNLTIIRQHAVATLHRHFRMTLCATGALENLTPEDYSITFSWASISPLGRSLTLHGKPDLALGYCMCEQFVAPVWASREDPEPTYVLNAFIQLQEPNRRSTAVLKRAREEDAAKSQPSPAKKFNNGGNNQPYVNRGLPQRQKEEIIQLVAQENKAILSECMKRAAPVSFDANFPRMPEGEGIQWNTSGVTGLPDV